MSTPTIQGIAGILTDPQADSTPQGKSILKLFIGMSDRRYNDQSNQWETSKSFAVEATAWEDRAERFAQGLSKGDQVYIEGRLETQQWEDKNGGGKRSKPVLTLNVLRKLEKGQQSGNAGAAGNTGNSTGTAASWSAPAEDPWASSSGNAGGWGGEQGTFPQSDEPPF